MRGRGVPRLVDLLDRPLVDGYGTVTVAEWGGWLVQVMPMIYNNRVVLTPKAAPLFVDYGWCYPKGPAAFAAVAVWDPAAQAEPAGYIKATRPGRQAGERAGEREIDAE